VVARRRCPALQRIPELLDRQPGLANQRTKRPPGNASLVRHDEPAVGRFGMAEDDVTSSLAVHLISKPLECANGLGARHGG
jgi:hypothetical protein